MIQIISLIYLALQGVLLMMSICLPSSSKGRFYSFYPTKQNILLRIGNNVVCVFSSPFSVSPALFCRAKYKAELVC